MPSLRSENKDIQENHTKVMRIVADQSQWVMIVPDALISSDDDRDCFLLKMPHPKNGVESLFAFKNGSSYQLTRQKESYRSWFIDESVQKDGSIFLVTPIDPLFLVLPYLEKFISQDKYVMIDNVLVDEKYPAAMRKLEECLTKQSLLNICNWKGCDDIFAYKADESKILTWLSLKIQRVASHIEKSNINVGLGSKVSTFIQVTVESKRTDDCLRFAWALISDYIAPKWSDKLKEKLSIKDPIKEKSRPPAKKQKLNDATAAESKSDETLDVVEDYRDHSKVKQPKKAEAKLSRALKSLKKVDTKGMKTMSSFFSR